MIMFKYNGIPVRLHASFWILVAFLLAPELIAGNMAGVVVGSLGIICLFGSVVAHEFGHALMAKRFGIGTSSITLYPFGGIAALTDAPMSSKAELYIALAGPAVNVALCFLLLPFHVVGIPLVAELIVLNLILGIFNLVPAFPMDGGRVLRAVLSKYMRRDKATHISLEVSKGFACVFVIGGLLLGNFSLALVGFVLFFFIWGIKRQVSS
jgi:Zn-dependent protease